MRPLRPILLLLCLAMAACQPGQKGWFDGWGKQQASEPITTLSSTPPEDFWVGVTVTGPVRENMSAYDTLPRALRPARYIVEADHVLRAAVGPGAKDEAFPAPTRRLSADEIKQLYRLTCEAGLFDADHPAIVGSAPKLAELPAYGIGSRSPNSVSLQDTVLATTYIISIHAGNKQRTLVMEASPRGNQDSRQAARVVDWLANKAWLKPSMQAR